MKKMKLVTLILYLSSLLAMGECGTFARHGEPVGADMQETVKAMTKQTFETVMPALMKEVTARVEKDGAASAVDFCNQNAPAMEARFNGELKAKFEKEYRISDYSFKRTALRIRNPKNAPDSLEKSVMWHWKKDLAAGKEIGLVMRKSGDTYYGMLPIRIPGPVCLKCHGTPETIDPEALKVIQKKYPKDHATGFKVGDLRGALSVQIKVK